MRKIEPTQPTAASKPSAMSSTAASEQKPRGTKGGVMRFLFRVAFWLSIVVILLPTPPAEQKPGEPRIGTSEALSAASATYADMKQFCVRQPDACTVGSQALTQFAQKAQAGAKMLYEFLSEKVGRDHTASVPEGAPTRSGPQNTLTSSDIAAGWRGPPLRKETEP